MTPATISPIQKHFFFQGDWKLSEAIGTGLVGDLLHLGGQFPSEGIFTSLGIKGGESHRVQKNLALHVAKVWWMFLDLDKLIFNHHLAHGLVSKECCSQFLIMYDS